MNLPNRPLPVALLLVFTWLVSTAIALGSSAENRQQISPHHATPTVQLKEGDIFAGSAEMLEENFGTVQLTLIINKISVRETDQREIAVEATVIMNAVDHHLSYGIFGYYLPTWRQLYLYGLREPKLMPSSEQKSSSSSSPTFPVGLAGEFSLDGLTFYSQIAFNGNATLKREHNTGQHRVHLVDSGLPEQ
jgi:hypothetical protein